MFSNICQGFGFSTTPRTVLCLFGSYRAIPFVINSLLSRTNKSLRRVGWDAESIDSVGTGSEIIQVKTPCHIFQLFSLPLYLPKWGPNSPHWVTSTWPLRSKYSLGHHIRGPFSCAFSPGGLVGISGTVNSSFRKGSEKGQDESGHRAWRNYFSSAHALTGVSLTTMVPPNELCHHFVILLTNLLFLSSAILFCWLYVGGEGW